MVAQLNALLINAAFAFCINMVFNVVMDTNKVDHSDWRLIASLGGPAKVARLLGYDAHGGTQRVQNWRYRGIPAEVKLEFPHLFLSDLVKKRPRSRPSAPQEGAGAASDPGVVAA